MLLQAGLVLRRLAAGAQTEAVDKVAMQNNLQGVIKERSPAVPQDGCGSEVLLYISQALRIL